MQNDWIMEQIEMMTQFLGKVFFQKDLVPEEFSLIDSQSVSEGDLTAITVRRLLSQNQINEAENLIFEEIDKDPSPRMLKIACDFYATLLQKTPDDLKSAGFGSDEITQGIRDLQKIYGIKQLDTAE